MHAKRQRTAIHCLHHYSIYHYLSIQVNYSLNKKWVTFQVIILNTMSPHIITLVACMLISTILHSQDSMPLVDHHYASNSVSDANLVSLAPAQTLRHPQKMIDIWLDKPLSLEYYSENEKKIQSQLNESYAEQIVTSSNAENKSEWTEIDFDPITPHTWKWIDFEMISNDGTHSTAQLRRPNWWIKKIKADKIGNHVYLDLPEMNMQGMATVVDIRVNQLDSRLLDDQPINNFINRPITGKYTHESKDIYHIYFDGVEEYMGVTGNHPLWSSDRSTWIPAQQLREGENVKTYLGKSKIKTITKHDGKETVYNLEVYRDHNYHASSNSVLAHNECWNKHWDEVLANWNTITNNLGKPPGAPVGATREGVRRAILDYEEAPRSGMVPWQRNTNHFLLSVDIEEELAIGEGAEKLIIRIKMTDEGFSFDNMITTDVLRTTGYEVRSFSENGMNWVEGTKDIMRAAPETPSSGNPSTIPARGRSNAGPSTIPIPRH